MNGYKAKLEHCKKDCFAYDDELDICTALNVETCEENCHFYKHSDNPLLDRVEIEMQIAEATSRRSAYDKDKVLYT